MNRSGHWLISGISVLAVFTFVLGYGINTVSASTSVHQSHLKSLRTSLSQPKWTPMHNVVLAKSPVPGYSGEQLELVEVNGQQNIDNLTEEKSWKGLFQLRLMTSSGRVLSKLNLPISLNQFQFSTSDYHGGSYPQFGNFSNFNGGSQVLELGQQIGKNGYIYKLFEITKTGITQLSVSTGLTFSSNHYGSPLFTQENSNAFQVTYYDNAKEKWFRATYTWQNGKFVRTDNVVVNQWTPIQNVVLAKSRVPGNSGNYLELIDVKGQYEYDVYIGPLQGNNWKGQFQLRLVGATGKVISKLKLPSNPQLPENVYGIFIRHFKFSFADYNGNGYPDFALGQYQDSNGYIFQIFAIEPSGIKRLPVSTAWIYAGNYGYSPLFKKVKSNAFQVTYFDNVKAKWVLVTYTWKRNKFIMTGYSVEHHT